MKQHATRIHCLRAFNISPQNPQPRRERASRPPDARFVPFNCATLSTQIQTSSADKEAVLAKLLSAVFVERNVDRWQLSAESAGNYTRVGDVFFPPFPLSLHGVHECIS